MTNSESIPRRELESKLAARIAVDIGSAIAKPSVIIARAKINCPNEAEIARNPAPAAYRTPPPL
jgi:hypothetical protein